MLGFFIFGRLYHIISDADIQLDHATLKNPATCKVLMTIELYMHVYSIYVMVTVKILRL